MKSLLSVTALIIAVLIIGCSSNIPTDVNYNTNVITNELPEVNLSAATERSVVGVY